MKKKNIRLSIIATAFIILGLGVTVFAQQTKPAGQKSAKKVTVKVYYLHSSVRCSNCKKFEKWSFETVNEKFASELKEGIIVYEKYNYEKKEHKHFLKDYHLVSKALVISRIENGKETSWKNLDKIWILVKNKAKFKLYVEKEIRNLLKQDKK